jgi:hypothetical protein
MFGDVLPSSMFSYKFIYPEHIPEVPKFLGPFNILEQRKKRKLLWRFRHG